MFHLKINMDSIHRPITNMRTFLRSLLLLLNFITTFQGYSVNAETATRVVAKAPMNPVNVNAILSVHCQIWHLQPDDSVSILRILSSNVHGEILSMKENVLQSIEDRVFLAVRTMSDGSSSYFLSIAGVKQSDEGDYECQVLRGVTSIAGDKVNIRVNHYPDGPPVCTPQGPRTIQPGVLTRFNCTTGVGSPEVKIQWSRTRDAGREKGLQESNQVTVGDKTYAELGVVLLPEDTGAVFVCEITSPVFLNMKQTCVVGPLTIPKSDGKPGRQQLNPTTVQNQKDYNQNGGGSSTTNQIDISKTKCRHICSTFSSPVFQWMMATVIIGLIAIIFCIIGLFLFCKYNRLSSAKKQAISRVSSAHTFCAKTEDIYDEVDVKPYMTLHRQPVMPVQTMTLPGDHGVDKDMQVVGYYRFAPKPVCT